MAELKFNSSEGQNSDTPSRSQMEYPLDQESKGALIIALEDIQKDVIQKRNRVQFIISSGATSFAISSDYMVLTGAAAVTIANIIGGREGQILTLEFTDSNITIADTDTGTVDTINLSSSFISVANGVIQLLYNGTSWKEVARSSPASSGSLAVSGQFNRAMNAANGTVVIAHGLVRTPVLISVFGFVKDVDGVLTISTGSSSAALTSCTYYGKASAVINQDSAACLHLERESGGNFQSATVSADATNITFTFTKTGAPTAGITHFVEWSAIA